MGRLFAPWELTFAPCFMLLIGLICFSGHPITRSPDDPIFSSPPHFFQPVAPVNPDPHADPREQKSQAHTAPELTRSSLPGNKHVVHRGRRWQREVWKIGSRKKTVSRH